MKTTLVTEGVHRMIWWTGVVFWTLIVMFLPDYTPWGTWLDVILIFFGICTWIAVFLIKFENEKYRNHVDNLERHHYHEPDDDI